MPSPYIIWGGALVAVFVFSWVVEKFAGLVDHWLGPPGEKKD
jgi:hypothetical protein